jgi:hypothetical protein
VFVETKTALAEREEIRLRVGEGGRSAIGRRRGSHKSARGELSNEDPPVFVPSLRKKREEGNMLRSVAPERG